MQETSSGICGSWTLRSMRRQSETYNFTVSSVCLCVFTTCKSKKIKKIIGSGLIYDLTSETW